MNTSTTLNKKTMISRKHLSQVTGGSIHCNGDDYWLYSAKSKVVGMEWFIF